MVAGLLTTSGLGIWTLRVDLCLRPLQVPAAKGPVAWHSWSLNIRSLMIYLMDCGNCHCNKEPYREQYPGFYNTHAFHTTPATANFEAVNACCVATMSAWECNGPNQGKHQEG